MNIFLSSSLLLCLFTLFALLSPSCHPLSPLFLLSSHTHRSFANFLKFAGDFDLASHGDTSSRLNLSNNDLANAFVSVRPFHKSGVLGKLTYDQFWQLLLRCALLAYREKGKIPIDDKMRALLMAMSHKVRECAVAVYCCYSLYTVAVLLHALYVSSWQGP